MKRITSHLHTLEQFPEAGTPILTPGSPVSYRYLVCGSYMAFYHVHNEEVMVDRILYGRRDYLPSLFGEELTEESEDIVFFPERGENYGSFLLPLDKQVFMAESAAALQFLGATMNILTIKEQIC